MVSVSLTVLQALIAGAGTYAELIAKTGLTYNQVQDALETLSRNGLATNARRGAPGQPSSFAPTDAGRREGVAIRPGPRKPHGKPHDRKDSVTAKVWRALRHLGSATIPEIAEIVGGELTPTRRTQINRYLRAVERAGFVRRARKRAKGIGMGNNGLIVWSIAKDPGPQAPVLDVSSGRLRDPNSGTVFEEACHG